MTKLEIFDDIVSIMEKDSSTCKDKGTGCFEKYRSAIKEDMTEDAFLLTLQLYLASFKVPGHLAIWKENDTEKKPGFSVRRMEDALYVTRVEEEVPVKKGDKIVALDGLSISEAAEKYSELLYGEINERQMWAKVLRLFDEITVENEKGRKTVPMPLVDKRHFGEPYEFRRIDENTILFRFDDFADDIPIHALIKEHEQDMKDAKNLIIDVRENAGGSDTAYFPLFDYCFGEGEQLPDDDGDEINFTERNVDSRLKLFEEYFGMDIPEDTRKILEQMCNTLKENRGKGFYRDNDNSVDINIIGSKKPEHVYILSDSYCGSSGDSFVENMRNSSKVTVVGRPTMGILDYSNEAMVHYDNYTFMYPTSRRLALDKGIVMGGKGVPVDIYIPFSEEHIHRDVDLEKVLEIIGDDI